MDLVKKTHSYGELPFAMAVENERGRFALITIPNEFHDDAAELGFITAVLEEARPIRGAAIQGGHLSLQEDSYRFKEEAYIIHIIDAQGEQIIGAVVDRHIQGPPTIVSWISTEIEHVIDNTSSVLVLPLRLAVSYISQHIAESKETSH